MKVLILEEDYSLYELIMKSPLSDKCKFYTLESNADISSFVKTNMINVVIIDIDKNKGEKFNQFKNLKKSDQMLNVILTGIPMDSATVMDLINHGALGYMEKPVRLEEIENILQKIIEKSILRKETYRLEKKLEKKYYYQDMIGKNPHMYEIFSLIDSISPYFSTALVTGETGTGKELVARAIHNLSSNSQKKLVICDTSSIPENLVESELFGYVKGAFTGADKDKKGLFEEAHKGIIFLDEIGEIPLTTQAKFLRVLENNHFRPVGSNETRVVSVKVIAATNRNLKEWVKTGTFRQDLYHRLNKVEIHLPPLRERPEDIPLLVRHFLQKFSKKFNKPIKGVSREVQKLFLKYNWPGNIRELENSLERASMLSSTDFIDISDLPEDIQNFEASSKKIPFISRENLSTLDDLEKEYILYLLDFTKKNLRKTATILDISRTTLYNKLKKYNIPH